MRLAAFTVDVDRDVNEPRAGTVESVCRRSSGPRYTSTRDGLELLVDMLGDLGIRGTFFFEGEAAERLSEDLDLRELMRGHEIAAHGYAHEDLTGESTGIVPSEEWLDAMIGRSLAAVESVFGVRPSGFRAPYQHLNGDVIRVLMMRGLRYDSTLFADVASGLRPYSLSGSLLEVPLAQGTDRSGRRIQSYLWAMHEGRRGPEDYLHLIGQHHDGLMVLADHSWHIAESLGGGPEEGRGGREIGKVRALLEKAMSSGVEFITIEDHFRAEEKG
ncbi:MAG: polysaccharide deacetylase family protein [Methanomassiliicoccus sp.]|nr:polysaccharide deacetylase family protein [Methanomassiliicoccus sp.]